MKFIYIILFASIIIPSSTFHIVDSQSTIKWKGSKSTGSYHDGSVLIDKGFINIHNNIIVGGEININMNSITCTDIQDSTSNQYLIAHLKNDDFFSVASFPIASLIINSIELYFPMPIYCFGNLLLNLFPCPPAKIINIFLPIFIDMFKKIYHITNI